MRPCKYHEFVVMSITNAYIHLLVHTFFDFDFDSPILYSYSRSRFAKTGGYVLKPPGRRDITLTGIRAREEKRTVVLRFTILSGQSMPLSKDEAEAEADRMAKFKAREEKLKEKGHSRSGSGVSATASGNGAYASGGEEAGGEKKGSKKEKIKGFLSRMKHWDGAEGFEP